MKLRRRRKSRTPYLVLAAVVILSLVLGVAMPLAVGH